MDQEEANGDDQEGKSSSWNRFYFKEHDVNIAYGNTFYLNGDALLVAPERENTNVWNNFIQRIKEVKNKHIEIGRYTFPEGSFQGASGYLEGTAYCFRVYGRSLSEEEVKKNYNKTIECHSLLTK